MFHPQNLMRIVYYIYEFCLCHVKRIMISSRIIQMAVLLRHFSQEILQYALIEIFYKTYLSEDTLIADITIPTVSLIKSIIFARQSRMILNI
jgi:hypothetical protein